MLKLSKPEWQVRVLAAGMNPVEAAIERALEINEGSFEDESDLYHATFAVLVELHEALNLPPASPDDCWVELREWLSDKRRRVA